MEARRARILTAATALMTDDGPDGLSMRRLAESADVSVNTIYNLIGPRDAVVAALVDQVIESIASAVDQKTGDGPLERCLAIVAHATEVVVENQDLTRPLAREIFGHSGPGSALAHTWGAETLGSAIAAAIDAGVLENRVSPTTLAETVYAVWANSALSWAHGVIDADGFEARSLAAVHMALLTTTTAGSEPELRRGLDDWSIRLEASRPHKAPSPSRNIA